MTASRNPLAPEHVPFFITPPGQTDVLFYAVVVFVVLCVIGLGVIFFTIHTLPERMAHRTKKVQLDFVAILGLIALFTNEHIYWIAALILAFIDLPDFLTPVQRIASAVENLTAGTGEETAARSPAPAETTKPSTPTADGVHGEAVPKTPERADARAKQKGPAHA